MKFTTILFNLLPLIGGSFATAVVAAPTQNEVQSFVPFTVQEPAIPARTAKVTDFGALPDGRTLATEAIAKGIEALSAQGGGHLVFPAGIWLTGPIVLKSNIDLHLETGALIRFSGEHELFYKNRNPGLIFGANLENISITGPGIIDGNGDAWRPVKRGKLTESQWKTMTAQGGRFEDQGQIWHPRAGGETWRPRLLVVRECKRVLLEETTFQNSPGWNLHPWASDDLTIRRVTIRNPWYSQNGDGLDIDACRNVIVRDCRLDVGDDALCMKSGKESDKWKHSRALENVLIENCVVYHGHGGFTIGSEMSGGVRNVRVDNCLFIGTDIGLRFKTQRGRGGVVENIFISNIRMLNIPNDAISFNMYYGGLSPDEEAAASTGTPAAAPAAGPGTPQFRNIYLENIQCLGAKRAIQVQGLPEMPIRGIHLRNVSIEAEQAILCQDARGISFTNVEVTSRKGPIAELINSREVTFDGLTYAKGSEVLFALSGKLNADITVRHTDTKTVKQPITVTDGAGRDGLKFE